MSTSYRVANLSPDTSADLGGRAASTSYPVYAPYPSRRPFNWELLWARCAYMIWQFLTKIILSSVYLTLIADGLKQFVPPLNVRLYKAFPFLSFLQDYEATHRIDLAQPAALLLMVFVWIAWANVLLLWLADDDTSESQEGVSKRNKDLTVTLAAILLIGESCLFYLSLVRVTWNGAALSVTAILGTVVYCTIVVFAVLHSLSLSRKCVALSRKENLS